MEKRFDLLDFATLNKFSHALMLVRYELSLCKMQVRSDNIDDFVDFISRLYSDVCLEQSKRYGNLANKFDIDVINSLRNEND